jgi:transposase InsO family protein
VDLTVFGPAPQAAVADLQLGAGFGAPRTSDNGLVDQSNGGLAEAGIEPSVGSVGDSYDNALAETINGLYKAELVHRQGPWRNMQDLDMATLGWVDWFNHRRLLGPIGNIPPAEAEENFYAQRDVLDMVA